MIRGAEDTEQKSNLYSFSSLAVLYINITGFIFYVFLSETDNK